MIEKFNQKLFVSFLFFTTAKNFTATRLHLLIVINFPKSILNELESEGDFMRVKVFVVC